MALISLGVAAAIVPSNVASAGPKTVTIPVGYAPSGVVITPSGTIYVVDDGSGNVTVLNSSNQEVTNITVGFLPVAEDYNSATGMLYVTNSGDNNLTIINTATNTAVENITTGSSPQAIAVDSVTGDYYAVNYGANTVNVFSGTTNALLANITVGQVPTAVAIDTASGNAFVVNSVDSTVSVISPTYKVLGIKYTDLGPQAIAYDPLNTEMYVVNAGNNTVNVLNSVNEQTNANITTVGYSPNAIAVDQVAGSLQGDVFVVNSAGNGITPAGTVSVINGATNKVIQNVTVGSDPDAIAISPLNGNIYVANTNDNTLTEILASSISTTTTTSSSTSSSTTSQSSSSSTTTTSSSSSSSSKSPGGIPEFPFQLGATVLVTVALVASYFVVRRHSTRGGPVLPVLS